MTSATKQIDEALMIIGRARMGKVPCSEALDRLWEILVNLDFELKMAGMGSVEVGLKPQLMN